MVSTIKADVKRENSLRTDDLVHRAIPFFGICLGYLIMGFAVGTKIFRMKVGYLGTNLSVVDLRTRPVYITSHNHGFAVDASMLPANTVPTHESLFDGSLRGFELTDAAQPERSSSERIFLK